MNYTESNFEDHIEQRLLESSYLKSLPEDYDKSLCLIPSQLIEFIQETQPKQYKKITEQYGDDTNNKLTKRISEQIESKGVIEVLRKGVKDRGNT
ncbi:type I restriction endonuclease subunit R, partial [Candidatus Woesearchaeota archaeon]|nr:type I restriction endonuclease subunit R [Candidatus Woesearchaeota archaeon]